MGILKTRFERATDVPLKAFAFVRGGRLVRIAAAGDYPHKPKVQETTAATDFALGAAATDAIAGTDVTITMTRGLMLLQTSEAVAANVDVYPSTNGRVQAFTGGAGDEVPAGARAFGRSWSAADGVDGLIWVKPYN